MSELAAVLLGLQALEIVTGTHGGVPCHTITLGTLPSDRTL